VRKCRSRKSVEVEEVEKKKKGKEKPSRKSTAKSLAADFKDFSEKLNRSANMNFSTVRCLVP
jgi:hypothetical protein